MREATARNEHAGEFFVALASWLEDRHRFDEAEIFYREAVRRMPKLIGPVTQLGLIAMQNGREAEAKKVFGEAFKADPFNVRVNNSLEVLELLERFETLENPQVVIKFDRQDRKLAQCAARYIERTYPQLCAQFGYRPPQKPLVEIFNEADGASGHQWFSTRMTGLPYLDTVAASTGHIVAMASPNDSHRGSRFNWARVLKHKLVHVITLQQTDFNMPHWYTEGLAVWSEDRPRPQIWNELLVQRVPAGKLFDLGSLNFAFAQAAVERGLADGLLPGGVVRGVHAQRPRARGPQEADGGVRREPAHAPGGRADVWSAVGGIRARLRPVPPKGGFAALRV